MTDYSKLYENLLDMVAEQQIKLGFRSEANRLYYPLLSLNRFLGTDLDADGMTAALSGFPAYAAPTLGPVEITRSGEFFCFSLDRAAQEYVHARIGDRRFLTELVETLSRHGTTMDDALDVFRRYSDRVVIEPKTGADFDVLAYFPDGRPDAYRYCLTDEGCHVIYHRFTAADYTDFYPEG